MPSSLPGAGGLCQSLGHGVLHGIGGQRRAGDTVDFGTLGREHLLPQGGQSLTAQGGGLIGPSGSIDEVELNGPDETPALGGQALPTLREQSAPRRQCCRWGRRLRWR